MLSGKSLLVTGGTGSFGKKFIQTVLEKNPSVRRVVVYSRDELKQFEMAQKFPQSKYPQMRYFIGDVRDRDRLRRAFENVDIVIHAAALKQVPAAEYNPFEAIKTNILGAQNVIECAIDMGIKNVVALSTDKACAPINLYGATKLCSDKLFVSGNYFKGNRDIKLSVVRYGNVMGSRGSVIPFFMNKRNEGIIPITDPKMTRFNITLEEGVNQVMFALAHMWGGEIFVPKIPSYRILDIADAIAPGCKTDIIGIRPGEKLHEEMITKTDAMNTLEFSDHYVILPSIQLWDIQRYTEVFDGKPCPDEFCYNSGTNTDWLTVEQLRELIRTHLDPNFFPDVTVEDAANSRRVTLKTSGTGTAANRMTESEIETADREK